MKRKNNNDLAALPADTSRAGSEISIPALQTPRVQAALANLASIGVFSQNQFLQLVLAQLEIIHDPDSAYGTRDRHGMRSPVQTMRKLKRWAKSARRIADDLRKQEWSSGLSPFTTLPEPPITALLDYAQELEERAGALQKSYTAVPARHKTHQETVEIIVLKHFVKEHTGKPHNDELVTLIQAATGDRGFNKERLRKIGKYHEKKNAAGGRTQDRIARPRATPRSSARPGGKITRSP